MKLAIIAFATTLFSTAFTFVCQSTPEKVVTKASDQALLGELIGDSLVFQFSISTSSLDNIDSREYDITLVTPSALRKEDGIIVYSEDGSKRFNCDYESKTNSYPLNDSEPPLSCRTLYRCAISSDIDKILIRYYVNTAPGSSSEADPSMHSDVRYFIEPFSGITEEEETVVESPSEPKEEVPLFFSEEQKHCTSAKKANIIIPNASVGHCFMHEGIDQALFVYRVPDTDIYDVYYYKDCSDAVIPPPYPSNHENPELPYLQAVSLQRGGCALVTANKGVLRHYVGIPASAVYLLPASILSVLGLFSILS